MSSLIEAANTVAEEAEDNNHDLRHIDTVEKLIHVCNIIADTCDGFIKTIAISPAKILHKKFEECDNIRFHISYDKNVCIEKGINYSEMQEKCRELITMCMDDEFDDIKNIKCIELSEMEDWTDYNVAYFYMKNKSEFLEPHDGLKALAEKLAGTGQYRVGIPLGMNKRDIVIYCDYNITKSYLTHYVNELANELGLSIARDDMNEKDLVKSSIRYSILKNKLYDLPYDIIDQDRLLMQKNNN